MSELTSKHIYLASHKKGQSFDDSFAEFVSRATRLTQKKVTEHELIDFQDELGQINSEAVGWLYFTRRERDKAEGEAYQKYPRGKHNSPEQDALSRRDSSTSTRNHKLVKEIMGAVELRKQTIRQKIEDRKMER